MSLALVAMQLALTMDDYASPAAFRAAMEAAAARASQATSRATHRLFVYPEAVGHFAPLCVAPALARRGRTVAEAIAVLAATRPFQLVRGLVAAGTPSLHKAVMHAILPLADRLVRETFAAIAQQHQATVVAGSHLVVRARGSITNTSYTFDPAGRLIAVTDKVNLVPTLEDAAPGGLGLTPGAPHPVIVHAPWGRLATLICYDGFREPHTAGERFAAMGSRVDAAGADVIANPAANPWPWQQGWIFAGPGESILRHEQWRTEGLPATLGALSRVRYGVTAHLCAALLDQRFEGCSEILERQGGASVVLTQAHSHDRGDVIVAEVPVPGSP